MRSESRVEQRGKVEVTQTSPKVRGNVLGLAQKTLLSVQVTNMGTIYTTAEVTSTDVENRRKSHRNTTDIPNNKGCGRMTYMLVDPHNKEIVAVATRDNTGDHPLAQSAGTRKNERYETIEKTYTIGDLDRPRPK